MRTWLKYVPWMGMLLVALAILTLGLATPQALVCGSVSSTQRATNLAVLQARLVAQRQVVLPPCDLHISGPLVFDQRRDVFVQGAASATFTTSTAQPGLVSYDTTRPVLHIKNQSRRVYIRDLSLAYISNATENVPAVLIEDSATLRFDHLVLNSTTIYDGVHHKTTAPAAPCGDAGPNDVCIVTLSSPYIYGNRGSGVVTTGDPATFGKLPVVYSINYPIIAGGHDVTGSAGYRANPGSAIIVSGGYLYLQYYSMFCDHDTFCAVHNTFFEPSVYGIYATGPNTAVEVYNGHFNLAGASNYAVQWEGTMTRGMVVGSVFERAIANIISIDTANVALLSNYFSTEAGSPPTAVTLGASGSGTVESGSAKFGGVL